LMGKNAMSLNGVWLPNRFNIIPQQYSRTSGLVPYVVLHPSLEGFGSQKNLRLSNILFLALHYI
jgi:hypothetical protein